MLTLITAALLGAATAQFVAPPADLIEKAGYAGYNVRYKEVPTGICELNPDVKSYSGYVDIAKDQHNFFWFFEARNQDPKTAPLTVWINGGPGSSSMIGLFQELGPCTIDADMNVVDNPYSWSNASNMLFIDEPTQVGFSYSIPVPAYVDPNSKLPVELPDNKCPDFASDWSCGTWSYWNESLTVSSTPQAAPQFYATLQGFMGAFPQYARNKFLFTTESYGGHYGPVFNEYIEQQNANLAPGAMEIHLGAVLIGNGWFDPLIQYQAYYNYSVYPGNPYFGEDLLNQTAKDIMYNAMYGPGNCYDMIVDCNTREIDEICAYADNWCYQNVENVYDIYAGRDEYDIRYLTPDPFPPTFYVDYLNTPEVQAAIGAFVNFTESSSLVSTAFGTTGDDGRLLTTVVDMQKLIAANLTVIMYFGDADYNCNYLGGQVVADEISPPGYVQAGYVPIQTSDGITHGMVRQTGKYSFVRIYESGHEVPFYQPLVSLEMFERAIAGLDIATGKVEVAAGYLTKGLPYTDYIEGNSTVTYKVLNSTATYNTTLNGPDPSPTTSASSKHDRFRPKHYVA